MIRITIWLNAMTFRYLKLSLAKRSLSLVTFFCLLVNPLPNESWLDLDLVKLSTTLLENKFLGIYHPIA